jgi:hypothetical protein
MFSLTDRPDHRTDDQNYLVYDCPHCGAENIALSMDYKGLEQPVIFRTKTMNRAADYLPCDNPKCRAYKVCSPYIGDRKEYKPAPDTCPECNGPRDKVVTRVER